ncbi:histidine kinase [Pedobacter sp. MC2016-05]|uniref:sensor histidine kinase n=1 Tax=Pedobacter sp. MC2016-05 TaxID=2994474 RepID=UPI002247937A|nr:ATP-binding protein [Pedobacter sp. MC2016-05]MCX2473251.1 histidine kinase [Pedobacter sp. MC2016-05]
MSILALLNSVGFVLDTENFSILYDHWPFILSLIIFLPLLTIVIFRKNKFFLRYKNEYLLESQAIKIERQRISAELHDELGSGLSAIKLFAELATQKHSDIVEFKELNEMIKEISLKINDIIWTTSTENDQLDSVIFYMEEQLSKLFKHSAIIFKSKMPELIPFLKIRSESRRNFYLLAKEIGHNTLKHSKATKVSMELNINDETISLIIKDNGKGFDPVGKSKVGMGLSNMNSRVKRLNGQLTIENYKGTKITVSFPIADNFYQQLDETKKGG